MAEKSLQTERDPCAEKLRRKIYRKIRFQTWYRKANYYHCKRHDLNKTIAQYRGVDVLSNKSACTVCGAT